MFFYLEKAASWGGWIVTLNQPILFTILLQHIKMDCFLPRSPRPTASYLTLHVGYTTVTMMTRVPPM